MKRAAGLAVITLICIIGCLSVQGMVPFVPVFGSGMEPAVRSGSLLITQPVKAADIQTGDIVICKVPASTREYYGYPPVLAQRVIEVIKGQAGTSFRLQADNAAGDPFVVRPPDIKGEVGSRVPYLGYPLMIFQSGGLAVLVFIAIFLFALYLYSNRISIALGKRFKNFISPVIEENHRADDVLSKRYEATEKALESFAGAMQEYAQHLASHTSAIRGLSEASQALKNSAAEQNHILGHMTASLVQQKNQREVARIKSVVHQFNQKTRDILQAKEALEKGTLGQADGNLEISVLKMKAPAPQGCVVKPKALLEKPHFSSVYSKAAD